MKKTIVTTSFEETQHVGFEFAKTLKGGEVLALYGDLGSGKTTFVQGLAKGLGIDRNIISPTFIIMRTYQVEDKKLKMFYHIDLYRIESEQDVDGLGLLELMHQPDTVVVIEWPDKIENLLPSDRLNISFTYLGDEKREIRFA